MERDRCLCPPGRLVSSCTSKGTGHREIRDCDGDIQGVSCSVQQLTVFICSHSHGSLQQQTVWNSHFAAHPCNFQSNSPVTRLPAFHKGNHSIGNSRALRVCFLFAIQHRLAKAAWCIPMVTLTATAHTPQHPKGLEKGATTRGGYCTHQPPALLLEKSSP